ncbi:ABC transporter ATP-binding protein [Roseiarcaceae bacterium H3SJ34-1]|uniref:ABC transporter ATP-binding protein n=1 Tax=Terripilifer ovatus TaxID=3032367 RepID=UPI003AB987CA|nr:ABC transporter ATP-binding protein [Roseiarcaceae bacterium H3SJ34-1]
MIGPALVVANISKRFGGVTAISDVSFEVPRGCLTALIGPNGAGKTTLFNLVTNLFPWTSGDILFNGASLKGSSSRQIAALGLTRTFQTARVFPRMTVLENVLVGGHRHVRSHPIAQALWLPSARRDEMQLQARAEEFLELAGLTRYCHEPATDLPMGSQKMLEVVRALMTTPQLLLLDEPAAGLNDSETAELAALLCAIRDCGVTIMLVEHNMSLVMSIADQVIVLDVGCIIASGNPKEIRRDSRVIAAYMGNDGGQTCA